MTIEDQINKKIQEFARIGRDAFLAKYANNRGSRSWFIIQKGKLYDFKAIWAAARPGSLTPSEYHTYKVKRELERLKFKIISTDELSSWNSEFYKKVIASSKMERSARQKRLEHAPKVPSTRQKTVTVFVRNPDVVAEALYQAAGVCGKCSHDAPFIRKLDKTPYLEVHHIKPLAEGGEDTVENAIALCPNCHRQAHHG